MNRVDQAMQVIKRREFLPLGMKLLAGQDTPVPIGHGQTNSQPTTVRDMLTWLDVQPSQRVLDVGSGSGWSSALLAHLVGEAGQVYAVERLPKLVEFGERNCQRLGITNVSFYPSSRVYGLPDKAPYDRILVSASANNLPSELVDQLGAPGRLVIPIKDTIWQIDKDPQGLIVRTPHPGYRFVPLLDSHD